MPSQSQLLFELNANIRRFIPTIIIMLVSGVMLLSIAAMALSSGGLEQKNSGIGLLMGLIGFGIIGWVIYQTVTVYQKRHDQVRVMNDKLIVTQKGVKQTVYWKDIVQIWQDVTIFTKSGRVTRENHCYSIQLSDQTKLIFDDHLKNVARLGNVIQQTMTPHLLIQAEQTLRQDKIVHFGNTVSITPEGIKFDLLLPWAEVKMVQIKNGYLVVDKKEGSKFSCWRRKKVSEIPNVFVLLNLANKRINS